MRALSAQFAFCSLTHTEDIADWILTVLTQALQLKRNPLLSSLVRQPQVCVWLCSCVLSMNASMLSIPLNNEANILLTASLCLLVSF